MSCGAGNQAISEIQKLKEQIYHLEKKTDLMIEILSRLSLGSLGGSSLLSKSEKEALQAYLNENNQER